jgi:hypothetical protein
MTRWLTLVTAAATATLITGCAGPAPVPVATAPTPPPQPAAQAAPAASVAAEAPEAPDASSAAEAADAAPEPSEPPPPAARPSEIVTAAGVTYILDYQSSDVSRAARDKCDSQAGDDPSRRADCMQKERGAFVADALRFKRGAGGRQTQWTIYRRNGDALTEVFVGTVAFADETATEVTLVPRGSAGARPLFQGQPKVVLGVPNTYELVVEDPRYGRLVYKARFEAGAGKY